jgi:protease-4
MGDVAASAGYWIAAQADTVVAAPTTLTGSIGVIMEWQNIEELFNKLGIASEVIKSGAFKDIGSPTRQLTKDERALLQGLVDDTYGQFLDDVAERRSGKISKEKLKEIADGRVFTGRQAKELGLVDELGNFYDAVDRAGALVGIAGEPKLKEYSTEGALDKLFSGLSSMAPIGGAADLTRGQLWQLLWKGVYNEPGKSYRVE